MINYELTIINRELWLNYWLRIRNSRLLIQKSELKNRNIEKWKYYYIKTLKTWEKFAGTDFKLSFDKSFKINIDWDEWRVK